MNDVYVYLAELPSGKRELYIEGKPTGIIFGKWKIRKLLSKEQWQQFKNGTRDIFYIPREKLPKGLTTFNLKTPKNGKNKPARR